MHVENKDNKYLLKTKRLGLQLLKKEDIVYLEELERDPEVRHFFPTGAHKSRQETEAMIDRFLSYYKERELPCFMVFELDSKEFVGRCGFGVLDTGEIEVGYIFHKKYWGCGYASETVSALLAWARDNINADYIIAYAPLDHSASLRVMEKCGMEYYKNDVDATDNVECRFYRIKNKVTSANEDFKKASEIINAEDYIIQTFQQYNIISLGEGLHALENSHQFFQKIFDNKKLQATINIIIVEFANIDYQDTLDRYISGETIDIKELSKVWRETTQSHCVLWDKTVYFEFLQKIRNVNLNLLEGQKIRVLAGDPPIDWKSIHTEDDYTKYVKFRDTLPAQLAIENGIKRGQKVLLLYGIGHTRKINDEALGSNQESITTLINKQYPGAMKVIEVLNTKEFQLGEQTTDWPLHSIMDLLKSSEGNLPAEKLFSSIVNKNGEKINFHNKYKVKDIIDAFLYVGPAESWKISEAPKSVFSETEYWNELKRRYEIVWGQALK